MGAKSKPAMKAEEMSQQEKEDALWDELIMQERSLPASMYPPGWVKEEYSDSDSSRSSRDGGNEEEQ